MSTAIIEINDAGITAGRDGNIDIVSPGYAVLDGDRLLIGNEGFHNSRLLPRWTNNRFWNQLGTEPIRGGTELIRHHADLAFAHLEQVWQSIGDADQVILAVPGFFSREQLGLLLGMTRECGIPVAGVVDTSLAATINRAGSGTVLHLDIFLHRITLTVLSADSFMRRVDTLPISETGLFTLWDRWANIIASQFIQTSRYDPMHRAVSEQELYDRLPTWIERLGTERSAAFSLDAGGNPQRVAVG
ncbi:MAG: hypothetical protein KDI19_12380, partial [Pseudomonadales bacterium]|nr:hypothetical protein [Pseudomonadales bacterium]